MPVNGLLLTLSADAALAALARRTIEERSEADMGAPNGHWQPLVADTSDVKAAHDFHEWLEALPGVEKVDVIYVGFDDPTLTEHAS